MGLLCERGNGKLPLKSEKFRFITSLYAHFRTLGLPKARHNETGIRILTSNVLSSHQPKVGGLK